MLVKRRCWQKGGRYKVLARATWIQLQSEIASSEQTESLECSQQSAIHHGSQAMLKWQKGGGAEKVFEATKGRE